ncbi:MAG: hypothetical protein ACE5KH_04065 [Candidatus Geothermarchaeales archaeon]
MRSRRGRRGVGGILAAVFMLLLLVLGFGVFLVILGEMGGFQESVDAVNTLEFERDREDLVILGDPDSSLTTGLDPRYLDMTVENKGFVEVRILFVGIFNITSNDVGTRDYSQVHTVASAPTPADSVLVNPGEKVSGVSHPLQLTSFQASSVNFTIHIVSDRGGVFTASLLEGVFVSGGQGEPGPPGAPGAPGGTPSETGPVKLEDFQQVRFVFLGSSEWPVESDRRSWMAGQEVAFGGYPVNVLPTQIEVVFVARLRNVDPQNRSITLNSFSSLQAVPVEFSSGDVYYIVNFTVSNPGTTSSMASTSAYLDSSPVTMPHNTVTTIYFGAPTPGDSATKKTWSGAKDVRLLNLVLFGRYEDGGPYAQNVPFEGALTVDQRIDTMSATSAGSGTSVTLTSTASKPFDGPTDVYWINSNGTATKVNSTPGTTTTVTFTVPSASAGFYGIMMTDGINIAYTTFEHDGT